MVSRKAGIVLRFLSLRRVATLALSLPIAIAIACVAGSAVSAQAYAGVQEVQNSYSTQCLDAHVNGAVFTDRCDGAAQQDWIQIPEPGAAIFYNLEDYFSHQYLDAHTNGAVFTDAFDGFPQQYWS